MKKKYESPDTNVISLWIDELLMATMNLISDPDADLDAEDVEDGD